MNLSYQWLKKFLDIDVPVKQLADKIEMTSVEYDGIIEPQKGLKKLVVGEILSFKKHPNADHLNICQVDVGADKPLQIICGAPNVAVHKKVIVALPNSWVGGHKKIKRAKMRGVVSNGMLCALDEIGFDKKVVPKKWQPGIYYFPDDAKIGDPIYKYLGMDDQIIDLDVTPNRGDMLSMKGIVYQLAANYNLKVNWKKPNLTEDASHKASDEVKVTADPKIAPIYKLRVLNNVKVAESPMWLQIRLWNCGVQPVNNVVDITNYIMLKYGQPIQAYDLDKLAGKQLTVRYAKAGETMLNADQKKIKLSTSDIVVADDNGPVAMAGDVDGVRAGVTSATKNVVLVAGAFNGVLVRKMAQRHAIHTEASQRFERGVDHGGVDEALDAAAALSNDLTKGTTAKGIIKINDPKVTPHVIKTSAHFVNYHLGTQIPDATIQSYFKRLGFGLKADHGKYEVTIPTRRWDVTIAEDLNEEVAKLYGLGNIPVTLPETPLTSGALTDRQKLLRKSLRLMDASGLSHAISYSLTTPQKAKMFLTHPTYETKLYLPLSNDRSVLRMNLIAGLLDDVAYNNAHSVNNVCLFEQGRVFEKSSKSQVRPVEPMHIAGAVSGSLPIQNWDQKSEPIDFYQLKGILDNYFVKMGIHKDVKYVATSKYSEMHPGRTANIYIDKQFVGFIGQVHPNVAKAFQIQPTYVFELNLDDLLKMSTIQPAVPIPMYPSMTRDVALLLNKDVTNDDVLAVIKKNGGKFLHQIKLFDVYTGEHVPDGKKSMAYTLVFLDLHDTLVEKTVDKAFAKIEDALKTELNAQIR